LNHPLYGLKQASWAWYSRFASYLVSYSRFASYLVSIEAKSDTSLFIYRHGDDIVYLLLYVDDIVLMASTANLLHRTIGALRHRHPEASWHVRLQVLHHAYLHIGEAL
jgi:hypothetical protein